MKEPFQIAAYHFDKVEWLVYRLITTQSKSIPHMWWCENVVMSIVHLENISKKMQHGSNLNYVKILLVGQVINQTQQSLIEKTRKMFKGAL